MNKGLGVHNADPKAPVSLVKWQYEKNVVADAIEMCDGFKNLDPGMKVVLKPNLVSWIDKYKFAPFGVLTTSVVIEGMIRALKEYGISDITIAEGTALQEEMRSATHIIYDRLNYRYLTKKYGVVLSDLNQEEHVKTKIGPFSLRIAKRILEAEYLINMPALKTHSVTKITLGFKNLKGCLHQNSKKKCHDVEHTVDEYLVHLGTRLYPQLVVVDGVYALERGPMYIGHAHRPGLLLASRDMFYVDCIGATLMGFEPSEIKHLRMFAKLHDRSLDANEIEIKGLRPAEHALRLEHRTSWSEDGLVPETFVKQGIQGVQMRDPGQSMCTGCSKVFPAVLMMLLAAYTGEPSDSIEILAGKSMKPSGKANTTFFMGDCNYAVNRKDEAVHEGVWLKGCPPRIDEVIEVFNAHGIGFKEESNARFFRHKVNVYDKLGYPYEDYYFPQSSD
ncbi:MAG: DUF362 domain-containing protein [Deltaproteobacteria bacterium]|nr:DUF362 domain-containing protein [Deltaproteobacteria bacterium]